MKTFLINGTIIYPINGYSAGGFAGSCKGQVIANRANATDAAGSVTTRFANLSKLRGFTL